MVAGLCCVVWRKELSPFFLWNSVACVRYIDRIASFPKPFPLYNNATLSVHSFIGVAQKVIHHFCQVRTVTKQFIRFIAEDFDLYVRRQLVKIRHAIPQKRRGQIHLPVQNNVLRIIQCLGSQTFETGS